MRTSASVSPSSVACWGFYGRRNVGDDLMLKELLARIGRICPAAHVRVLSASDDVTRLVPDGLSVEVAAHTARALLSACLSADLLIVGPGGLFPHKNTAKLVVFNLAIDLMRLRGRHACFVGIGVGQGCFATSTDRALLRRLVRHSDAFLTRQAGMARQLDLPSADDGRFAEVADALFAPTQVPPARPRPGCVAFALADVFEDQQDQRQAFLRGLAPLVDEFVEGGHRVRLLSFTAGRDERLNEALRVLCAHPESVEVVGFPEDPARMLELMGEAEFCVCMRFHALVFASLLRIGCCMVSYSDKMDDVAARLGLADRLVRVGVFSDQYFGAVIPFDAERFSEIARRALAERDVIAAQLAANVPALERLGARNWDELAALLGQGRVQP